MKNKLKVLMMLVIMFFISGSYKNNGIIEINEDRSVDVEIIYAVDNGKINEMINSINGTEDNNENVTIDINNLFNKDDIKKIYEEAGFSVTDYTEIMDRFNWEGLKIKKHYNNIDDITSDKEVYFLLNKKSETLEKLDDSKLFSTKDNNYLGNILIYLDFNYEPGLVDYSKYMKDIDLKYIVRLPRKVINSNATDVSEDGKELVWKLEMGNKNHLSFEFDLPEESFLVKNKSAIMIGTSALLIVVILVIVFINRPKKKVLVDENANKNSYKPLDAVSLTGAGQNTQDVINQNNNTQNM